MVKYFENISKIFCALITWILLLLIVSACWFCLDHNQQWSVELLKGLNWTVNRLELSCDDWGLSKLNTPPSSLLTDWLTDWPLRYSSLLLHSLQPATPRSVSYFLPHLDHRRERGEMMWPGLVMKWWCNIVLLLFYSILSNWLSCWLAGVSSQYTDSDIRLNSNQLKIFQSNIFLVARNIFWKSFYWKIAECFGNIDRLPFSLPLGRERWSDRNLQVINSINLSMYMIDTRVDHSHWSTSIKILCSNWLRS